MELQEFINKNKIHLDSAIIKFDQLGQKQMQHHDEPLHNPQHISRILADLNSLDEWSPERIQVLQKTYLNQQHKGLLHLGKFYLTKIMARKQPKDFYLAWSKKQFITRKQKFMQKIHILLQKYSDLLK